MGKDQKNQKPAVEQFTKWIRAHRLQPAWRALGFPARDAYFHLRVRCFAESAEKKPKIENNNGKVYRSPRKLAEDMGCDPKTAMAALADLQARGWIVCTQTWERGFDGKGRTALWRLTEFPVGNQQPTKEYQQWTEGNDFPVVVYASYKPGRKKQNPPPPNGAPVNQILVHCEAETRSSAPDTGAEIAKNHQSSAPDNGAYLIAMGKGISEAFKRVPPFSAFSPNTSPAMPEGALI